jgi:hypothetical protein
MRYDLTAAILSLCPGATWVLTGDDYKTLQWNCASPEKPSEAALRAEVDRLQAAWDHDEYKRKRAAEYPPMADYLDAVVKGDTTGVQQYVAACLAVKAKYPKG